MAHSAVGCTMMFVVSLLAAPQFAYAQPARTIPRVGVLYPGFAPGVPGGALEHFRQGLRDLGYVEGKSIFLEVRWDDDQPARWSDQVAGLVQLPVNVIVAGTTATARVAQQATRTIPIVVAVSADPVADGLVASLARPGGNVTGLSIMTSELAGKRLALLASAVPGLTRVAMLLDAGFPRWEAELRESQAAAQALGMQLMPIKVRGPEEFADAFKNAKDTRAQAMLLMQCPLFAIHGERLAQLALASRLPTMFGSGDDQFSKAGGLMSFGSSIPLSWYRAATYVHKILQGAEPANLPIEQPTRFQLFLNRKTADSLGLTLPASLLLQSDLENR